MKRSLRRIWKDQRPLVAAFAIAIALALFFVAGEVRSIRRLQDTPDTDPPIAGWMTPRYVAHSWQIPPEVIAETLSLEQDGSGRRLTLRDLADTRSIPVDELIRQLDEAISRYRADK